MSVKVGAKVAEVADSSVWDSNLQVREVKGEFRTMEVAEARAREVAKSEDDDAAVLYDSAKDRYVVVTVTESDCGGCAIGRPARLQ